VPVPKSEESAVPSTSSLFEREMRDQITAAEAGVLDSLGTADPILIESARGHLDGLVDLARRNGIDVKPLIPAEREISLDPPAEVLDQPA
jgi:hypothetical protein